MLLDIGNLQKFPLKKSKLLPAGGKAIFQGHKGNPLGPLRQAKKVGF